MARLFTRSGWVQIGDLQLHGLHFKFKVVKTLTGNANTLDLQVYNLSAASRAKLTFGPKSRPPPVLIMAGYEGAEGLVFFGDPRTIDHVHHTEDWITHCQAGDAEVKFEEALSAKSFAPGVKVSTLLGQFANDLGVSAGDALHKLQSGEIAPAFDSFLQGYTAHGRTVRELDRVVGATGLEWSVQDGELQILERGQPSKDSAVLLTPDTGLIGSPDHGKPTKPEEPSYLRVRSLLQPAIRPGRLIKVQAERRPDGRWGVDGFYRVERVTHTGDLYGNEWYTESECVPRDPPT